MAEVILQTRGLGKRYRGSWALRDFSASLENGKIYGLLGRNGAGKTTFLNCVTSRIFADVGEATVFGEPAVENPRVLPRICYMSEQNLFMKNMRVSTQLRQAARFYPRFDSVYAEKLCRLFELDTRKTYRSLSRGYESMLRIVIGLASRAELTIFDEPVLGLDAAVRDLFYKELLADFSEHPRTVLFSTHLIEESADLFEEVLLIRQGKLISQTSVDGLRAKACYVTGRAAQVEEAVRGLRVLHSEDIAGMRICVVYGRPDAQTRERWAAAGLEISAVPIQKLFIYLTDAASAEKKEEA